MPPRGYRDARKAELREFADSHPEQTARVNAQSGLERDLRHLVGIAVLMDRNGITAWAAAGEIAKETSARGRHATQKRLHSKFQKAPALYHRLAAVAEHPDSAAELLDREIHQEIVGWPRGRYRDLLISQHYYALGRRRKGFDLSK
jgi:hypothetical protein